MQSGVLAPPTTRLGPTVELVLSHEAAGVSVATALAPGFPT